MIANEQVMALYINLTTISCVVVIALVLFGTMTYRRHRATSAEYPRTRSVVLQEAFSDLGGGVIMGIILVGLFVTFESLWSRIL